MTNYLSGQNGPHQNYLKPGPAPTGRDKVFDTVYNWLGGTPANRWAAEKITDVATLGGFAPWTAAYDGGRELAETGRPGALAMAILPGARVAGPVAKVAERAAEKGIRAFHGSPHSFDRFDLSKIGTGEGAQAYGHGLYFAENEGVARSYKDALSVVDERSPSYWASWAFDEAKGDRQMASALLSGQFDRMSAGGENAIAAVIRRARGAIDRGEDIAPFQHGHMYEVNIKANPDDFLDWDKPLSQQSAATRDRFNSWARSELDRLSREPGNKARRRIEDIEDALRIKDVPFGILAKQLNLPTAGITKSMAGAGIPGIRYLDQGSRTAGEGSRNYVVFDDALIEIMRKYGLLPPALAGGVAAAQSDPAQASP